jgi:nucleotidyltransferase/DNA polymerase involved in DNA repair
MVKPPKTMQPEAVNLKKAGRDANKAFGDDSFRNYMARKIAMQRQQFGLMLPPVPRLDAQDAHHQGKMIDAGPGDNYQQRSSPLGRSPPTNNGDAHDNDDDNRPFAAKRKRFEKSGMAKRSKTKHGEKIVIEPLLLKSVSDKPRPDDVLTPLKRLPSMSSPFARETEAAAAQLLTSALTGRQESPSHGASQPTARTPDCQLVASPYATKLRSDLFFLGTVVLINGYTNPDAETLQRLLHKHGGDVEKYETSRVTHIIAEQLSTAKAKMYQKQRNPRPVCLPGWIMDSVKEGRKLPCAAYLLDEVRKESLSATKSVANFYTKKQIAANTTPAKASMLPPLSSPGEDTADHKQFESPEKNRFINGRIRTVGTDPNFLESFFAASRLSFIGSYKQRTGASPSKTPIARNNNNRYVLHVDMDCFFASVVLRDFPEYRDKPVAISHNGIRKNDMMAGRNVPANSSSECATCNYVAREFGIKKGMYLGRAKELCPELIVLQYDFDGYEEVSEAVHEILLRHSAQHDGFVEQVSCDESYIEMFLPNVTASCSKQAAISLAETIRNEIFEATQCTATIGVASNKLLAKLATDFAKPNKSYLVENPRSLLSGLDLHQLPGVGYHFRRKLQEHLLVSVADVWKRGLAAEADLCDIVGNLNGKKLYGYCHGIDNRELQPSVRKTIGAEVSCAITASFEKESHSIHLFFSAAMAYDLMGRMVQTT